MSAVKSASATSGFHEDLGRTQNVKESSPRGFGIVFAVVFALIGLAPLTSTTGSVRTWALIAAGVFLGLALVAPHVLAPLNRQWLRFGALLHRVTNPIVTGFLFFGVITPTALLLKLLGKDLLKARLDPTAASYWVRRDPPGPAPETMRNQF